MVGEEHRVAAGALYRAYVAWEREEGEGVRLSPHAFGRRMRKRFRRERNERGREYTGIGLGMPQNA